MKNGEKDSYMIHIHPEMEKDEYLIGKIKELVTYVRKSTIWISSQKYESNERMILWHRE